MQTLELVSAELDRLVARLRSIGAARLAAASVPPFATRADAAWHLVLELAAVPDDQHGSPRRFTDLLLGDQIAVVGADALAALAFRPDGEAEWVLGEVVLHRCDVDGSLPKGDVARALGGDDDLVARLRARCPAA